MMFVHSKCNRVTELVPLSFLIRSALSNAQRRSDHNLTMLTTASRCFTRMQWDLLREALQWRESGTNQNEIQSMSWWLSYNTCEFLSSQSFGPIELIRLIIFERFKHQQENRRYSNIPDQWFTHFSLSLVARVVSVVACVHWQHDRSWSCTDNIRPVKLLPALLVQQQRRTVSANRSNKVTGVYSE